MGAACPNCKRRGCGYRPEGCKWRGGLALWGGSFSLRCHGPGSWWLLSVWEAGSGSAGVWDAAVRESFRGKAEATERKGRVPLCLPRVRVLPPPTPPFSPGDVSRGQQTL